VDPSQKASNLLADVLYSFNNQVQIGIFRSTAASGIELGSNYKAAFDIRFASKVIHIAHAAKVITYHTTP
jgi:hypothetical protein